MHINITYPSVKKGKVGRRKLLSILRWPFISAAVASVTANLCIGSPYWFPIVLLSLWGVWKFIFATSLVEYNRISQFVKLVIYTCVLLTFVDIFIISGWAMFVVPIVCFSGIILCSILFFTDMETQKHNMFPLILLVIFSVVASGICLIFWHERDFWPFIVLAVIAALILISFIIIIGADFKREMQRRFHIK